MVVKQSRSDLKVRNIKEQLASIRKETSEAYSESSQISKMEILAKIVSD